MIGLLKSENKLHIIEDPREKPELAKQIKDHSIKLTDSAVISLCISMFDWPILIAIGTDN